MLLIYITLAFQSLAVFVEGATDPCTEHEQLNDTTRSVNHVLDASGTDGCDRHFKEAWYLLKNPDITDMPTSCVPVLHCGTSAPIWLNGTLPTKTNEVKTMKACKVGFGDCCKVSFDVDVKHCPAGFNVFHLKPISTCYGRYCFSQSKKKCRPGMSSATGNEPCKTALQFYVNPRIQPHIPSHTDKDRRYLVFQCGNIPFTYRLSRFDVRYYIDGNEVSCVNSRKENIKYEDLLTDGALTSSQWSCTGKKLDFKVKCEIRIRRGSEFSEWKESVEFYAGLQVTPTNIKITAGSNTTVGIRSTVPIACARYDNRYMPCDLQFEMLDLTQEKSSGSCAAAPSDWSSICGFVLDGWRWNQYQYMTITTKKDPRTNHAFTGVIRAKSVGLEYDPLWKDYLVPDIEVQVSNSLRYPTTGHCSSHEDPTIHTSDGSSFGHHGTGEYVLYKHKTKPIAIHVIHYPRRGTWTTFTSNCAVAVKAASDIFVVYGCKQNRWEIRRMNCQESKGAYLDIYERSNGLTYEIHLPTGTRVEVNIIKSSHYLNVDIYPVATEHGLSHGLCGHFNGKYGDDYKDEHGRSMQLSSFVYHWRVQESNSLFTTEARAETLRKSNVLFCSCRDDDRVKETQDLVYKVTDCTWKESVSMCPPPGFTPKQCRIRHARDVQLYEEDDDDIDASMDVLTFKPAPQNIDQWKNGWTESKARSYCTNVLHSSTSYSMCNGKVHGLKEEESINICVNDIRVSGTTRFSLQSTGAYTSSCLNQVRLNMSLWKENDTQTGKSLAEKILDNHCPNDCSVGNTTRGNCVSGRCNCFRGYTSDDCSVGINDPPMLTGSYKDSLCDLSKKKCLVVPVYGDNFLRNAQLKCKIVELDGNGLTKTSEVVTGSLESFNEVRCAVGDLHRRRRRSISSQNATTLSISITTNGNVFSQPINVVIYDSSCLSCTNVNGKTVCLQKSGICIVQNKCYPLTSRTCSGADADNKTNGGTNVYWIFGVVFGGLALLFVIGFLFIKAVTKNKRQTGIDLAEMSDKIVYNLPPKATSMQY